jgi:hypothetical protein
MLRDEESDCESPMVAVFILIENVFRKLDSKTRTVSLVEAILLKARSRAFR